jgi:hypothetical protein
MRSFGIVLTQLSEMLIRVENCHQKRPFVNWHSISQLRSTMTNRVLKTNWVCISRRTQGIVQNTILGITPSSINHVVEYYPIGTMHAALSGVSVSRYTPLNISADATVWDRELWEAANPRSPKTVQALRSRHTNVNSVFFHVNKQGQGIGNLIGDAPSKMSRGPASGCSVI